MNPDERILPDTVDILLVDDDPLDVELALRSFARAAPRRQIGVAYDGEEALDYLLGRGRYRHRFGAPAPRLTLLDLKLPKVDGLEVLRALRANPRTNAAPVVVFTSAADPRDVAQSYHFGANSCVQKPVALDAFDRTIQSLARYWLELNESPPAPTRTAG